MVIFRYIFRSKRIIRSHPRQEYQQLLEKQVLPGLEEYFDTERTPVAYSSYIRTTPTSDRFYDDNIWVGIDFIDIYQITKEKNIWIKLNSYGIS